MGVNITFVIVGICFIIASSIKYFLSQSHYNIHESKTIARLLFFIFIPIDIYFLVYVQNIYKTLKPKKEEEDCTTIIFLTIMVYHGQLDSFVASSKVVVFCNDRRNLIK